MADELAIARHVARLFASYPMLKPDQVREGTQAYATALSDIPSKYVGEAIVELTRSSQWLPSIFDLRKLATEAHELEMGRRQIAGPGSTAPADGRNRARDVCAARLFDLHAATAEMRAILVDAHGLNEPEAKMLLEQEIKTRLWRAACHEVKTGERPPLAISDAEKLGWRERCESWSRLKGDPAMRRAVHTTVAKQGAERHQDTAIALPAPPPVEFRGDDLDL